MRAIASLAALFILGGNILFDMGATSLPRLEAASDGLFAVISTVLVVQLSTPLVSDEMLWRIGIGEVSLKSVLTGEEFLFSFGAFYGCFLIISLLWVQHLIALALVESERASMVLKVLSFGFLLPVTLLPFTAGSLGPSRYEQDEARSKLSSQPSTRYGSRLDHAPLHLLCQTQDSVRNIARAAVPRCLHRLLRPRFPKRSDCGPRLHCSRFCHPICSLHMDVDKPNHIKCFTSHRSVR